VHYEKSVKVNKYIAQLSHRNRAAGWVIIDQNWKTIFCTRYRFIFNHCDEIGLQSSQIRWNKAK